MTNKTDLLEIEERATRVLTFADDGDYQASLDVVRLLDSLDTCKTIISALLIVKPFYTNDTGRDTCRHCGAVVFPELDEWEHAEDCVIRLAHEWLERMS